MTQASFLLSIFVKGSKRGSVNELPLCGLGIVEKKQQKGPYNKVQSTEKNSVCLGLIWMNAPRSERNNDQICEETADFQKGLSTMETFSYMKTPLDNVNRKEFVNNF
ncbi:MAG: hypothetical protein ACRCWW_15475 [Scandinavium sp.]|uniref:hypothetical protein n=1 Tax=Scandinavium sp. TaxID=2830653 RepID=UPI003F36FBAD